MDDSSLWSLEALRNGVRNCMRGGLPHDEGTSIEDRLVRMIDIIQRDKYQLGRLSVQLEIRKALGLELYPRQ